MHFKHFASPGLREDVSKITFLSGNFWGVTYQAAEIPRLARPTRDPTEWIQRALLEPQLGAINLGSRDADARRVRQVTRSAFR